MSAKAANSVPVRHQLRNRARYEVFNNTYAQGAVWTLANDRVGTGPRLQMRTGDAGLDRAIDEAFAEWSAATRFGHKLWEMSCSQVTDGEAFGMFITNHAIPTEIKLDIRTLEADQITTPYLNPTDPYAVDGIQFDTAFNPIFYSMLRYHPGDPVQLGYIVDTVPAYQMMHWFRKTRPGIARGIPDLMPALPLFAQLRRYTLAVLGAAEVAADYTAVLYSEMPADSDMQDIEPLDRFDIDRNMMTTLPAGWKLSQFKAEQPTGTYSDFKQELLKEIGRCLNMPYNIIAGDSSQYNYSSGRMDHQTYGSSVRNDRKVIESIIVEPTFRMWMEEAWLATDILKGAGGPGRVGGWPHQWFWDGREHVDPMKEASAQEVRLRNNTTTLADEYAKSGHYWVDRLEQRALEIKMMEKLGIPFFSKDTSAPQTEDVGDEKDPQNLKPTKKTAKRPTQDNNEDE